MKPYFFTDLHLIDVQTSSQAFGPKSGSPNTEFRVTSLHTASSNPLAYAVADGLLFAQEIPSTNLLNLILQPRDQEFFGYTDIKYFIYRGIDKNSLVDTAGTGIRTPAQNDLAQLIIDTQNSLNASYDEANGLLPGTTTDLPSSSALGIHFSSTAAGSDQRVDSDLIESIFHNESSKFSPIPVRAGDSLGTFTGTFGFDIMIESMGFSPQFESVRGSEKILVAPAVPASPNNQQRLANLAVRELVFNYLDPCTFYSMAYSNKVLYFDSGSSMQSLSELGIYDNILVKFANKNRVYLDIRNENNRSVNYYDNYGNDILAIYEESSSVSPSTTSVHTDDWPLIILENADFSGTTNPNNPSKKNIIRLQLPKGDNTKPLLYLNSAIPFDSFPKTYRDGRKFLVPEFIGTNSFSEEILLAIPNNNGLSVTTAVSWMVKMTYIRRTDALASPGTTMVVPTKHYLDNVFCPSLLHIPFDRPNAAVKFQGMRYQKFIDAEDTLGVSFIADIGIAKESNRVIMFAQPRDFLVDKRQPIKQSISPILAGTSNKSSFLAAIENQLSGLTLKKKKLQVSTSIDEFCLSYDKDGSNQSREEDFFAVCFTNSEFNALAGATGLDPVLHSAFLKVSQNQDLADMQAFGYSKLTFQVQGIDNTGNLSVLASPSQSTLSIDGTLFSSDGFASTESIDVTDNEEFYNWDPLHTDTTNTGALIWRIADLKDKKEWELHTKIGTVQQESSADIKIPFGNRVVKLSQRLLNVPGPRKKHIRITSWHNGALRDGYIDPDAFVFAKGPREYNPRIKNNPRLELLAFLNDAEFALYHVGLWMPGYSADSHAPIKTLIESVEDRYQTNSNSFRNLYEQAILALPDETLLNALYSNFNSKLNQPVQETNCFYPDQSFMVNSPFYLNSNGKVYNTDKPKSVEDYQNVSTYKNLLNTTFTVALKGNPSSGTLTFQYDSNPAQTLPFSGSPPSVVNISSALALAMGINSNMIYSEIQSSSAFTLFEQVTGYRFVILNVAGINIANLTVSGTFTGGANPAVEVHHKMFVNPLTFPWMDKFPALVRNLYDNQMVALKTWQGYYSGEVWYIDGDNGAGMVTEGHLGGHLSSIHNFTAQSVTGYEYFLLKLVELQFLQSEIDTNSNYAAVKATTEGQWIINYDLTDIDSFIQLHSYVWSDYDFLSPFGRPMSDDYHLALWAEYIPIDQSVGYVNSNAVASIFWHENTQSQESLILDVAGIDTHGAISVDGDPSYGNEFWDPVIAELKNGALIGTALTNVANNNPGDLKDVITNFYQYQSLLTMIYLGHYADLLGL